MKSSSLTKKKDLEATLEKRVVMEHIYTMMNASYIMGMHSILLTSDDKGGN